MSVRSLPSLWELFQRASSLSTEIFDKAPSGQVTPYSCLLCRFDDGMTSEIVLLRGVSHM